MAIRGRSTFNDLLFKYPDIFCCDDHRQRESGWYDLKFTTKQKLLRDVNRFVLAFARAVIQYGYTLTRSPFTDPRLIDTVTSLLLTVFLVPSSYIFSKFIPLNTDTVYSLLSVCITLSDCINLGGDHLQPCVLNPPPCMHRRSRLHISVALFPDWNCQIFVRFKLGASIR